MEGFKDLNDKDKLEKLKESAIEVDQDSIEIQDTVETHDDEGNSITSESLGYNESSEKNIH